VNPGLGVAAAAALAAAEAAVSTATAATAAAKEHTLAASLCTAAEASEVAKRCVPSDSEVTGCLQLAPRSESRDPDDEASSDDT